MRIGGEADSTSIVIGSVKFIAMALLMDEIPFLIPYALLPVRFETAIAIVSWFAHAIAIYFYFLAVRLAASFGIPPHG